MYNHMQDNHRNETFYCDQCQYKTKSKANLEIHLVETHKNSEQRGTKFSMEKMCMNYFQGNSSHCFSEFRMTSSFLTSLWLVKMVRIWKLIKLLYQNPVWIKHFYEGQIRRRREERKNGKFVRSSLLL